MIKQIRDRFVSNQSFTPPEVAKVSAACEGLCKWVLALERYDRVIKVVQPKRAKLNEAEEALSEQMSKLQEKQRQVQELEARLKALTDEYETNVQKKNELEDQRNLCEKKLTRAVQLIEGLGGEKDRWTDQARKLGERYIQLTGDILLSAGVVAYLGPFTVNYRTVSHQNSFFSDKLNDLCRTVFDNGSIYANRNVFPAQMSFHSTRRSEMP